MSLDLLQALHDAGEALRTALDDGAYEAAQEAAQRRGALMAQLTQHPRPAAPSPAWTEQAQRLQQQHQALAALLAEHEQQLLQALATTNRQRDARAGYGTAPPPSGRLRPLHG